MKRRLMLLLLGLALVTACRCGRHTSGAASGQEYFVAEPVQLMIPKLAGWQQDKGGTPEDPNQGGIVLRLGRESAVVGSPRIDVVLEPVREQPTLIEEFLRHNLQQMGDLESAGQIKILQVEQHRVFVGSHPAYRVRHEYTVGRGTGQAAINQVSTFVVLSGRGVAVTAAGRTELFHPLADSIETMLDGMRLRNEDAGVLPTKDTPAVDLGRVGGKSKRR